VVRLTSSLFQKLGELFPSLFPLLGLRGRDKCIYRSFLSFMKLTGRFTGQVGRVLSERVEGRGFEPQSAQFKD